MIIVLASTGDSIGDTGFESLHRLVQGKEKISVTEGGKVMEIGEAGIMLDDSTEIRGKGYAVETLSMIFDYGFEVLGLDEVMVRTMEVNGAMRGVMERKFAFGDAGEWKTWDIADDREGRGGDWEGVRDAPLGRVERYWKVMSDRVAEGERECAMCYSIEREKWRQWKNKGDAGSR